MHHTMALQIVHDILGSRAKLILRHVENRLPRFRVSGALTCGCILPQLQIPFDHILGQQSRNHHRGSDVSFVLSPLQRKLLLLPHRHCHSMRRYAEHAPVRVTPAHRPGRPVLRVEWRARLEVEALVQSLDTGQYAERPLHPLGVQVGGQACKAMAGDERQHTGWWRQRLAIHRGAPQATNRQGHNVGKLPVAEVRHPGLLCQPPGVHQALAVHLKADHVAPVPKGRRNQHPAVAASQVPQDVFCR
mmetsp:Transcript_37222/g.97492  ORF Transcript_37222/g.97492 Transcript_37222/m.97492 type:complete len:246 (+) Transcript_37222:512-1249(+)